jgi:outer membrane receptor protein involved in Fe transport
VTDRVRIPTATVTRRISRADVDADDASLRLIGRRPLGNGFLRVGLEANSRFNLHALNEFIDFSLADQETLSTSEIAVANAYRIDLAAFAEADQTFFQGRLAASAGLRGDTVTTRNSGGYYGDRETSNGAFSGFAALTLTPVAGTSVTAQYSHGFRDPLLSDRYFRGVSGRGFVVGNPDLSPEKSDQYDLAIRGRFGPVYAAAYGYLYRIRNLAERYREGDDFHFRNRGVEEIRGAELEASVRLSSAIAAGIFGTLISGKILDDGSAAGDVPANSLGLSVDAQPLKNLWVRARFAAYQRDDDFGSTETATPGYGVFDLSAGYRFLEALEVRVVARNLFDKEYPATSDALSVVAPGRNVTFVLAGRF